MKHLTLVLMVCQLMACQRGPETNEKGDRVHLVVNSSTTAHGSWEKISAPMTWWINIHGEEALYRNATREFTREQVVSFVAYAYLNDIAKEGHQWFFTNTAPLIQQDVLEGLRAVGLPKAVEIYQQALQKFEQTKNREADFTPEDTGIILLQENTEIEKIFRAYASANANKFYYDQWVKKPGR